MVTYLKYYNIKQENYDYVKRLPVGWQLLPNIAIYEERIERGFTNEELLSVTISNGIIKQKEIEVKKDSSNEDKSNYKLIKEGDIAYNKMRMWQGAVGYSNYRGITSPAYVILKPKHKLNSKFFHYLFRTRFYNNYSKRFSYGIVDDQLSLRYTDFKRMYSIVPPIHVQDEIVDYLDRKNSEIEEYIVKKEDLISLLKEKKKSFQELYTRVGLNNVSKLRLSHIAWLGNINSDWQVLPNIAIFKEIVERNRPDAELLSVTIGKGIIRQLDSEKRDSSTLDKSKYLYVQKGDFVYSMRFRQGSCGVSNLNGIVSPACTVLRPREPKQINLKFYYYLFKTQFYKEYIECFSYGIADGQIPLRYVDFKRMYSLVPPITVQNAIVKLLDEEFTKIDKAIDMAMDEIHYIKEFRESLISFIVTGKHKIK